MILHYVIYISKKQVFPFNFYFKKKNLRQTYEIMKLRIFSNSACSDLDRDQAEGPEGTETWRLTRSSHAALLLH